MSKPAAPARSVERQRLADAIGRHRERADDLSRIERAIAKITDDRVADRVAIGRARDAVEIARGAESQILVSRALGEELVDQPDLGAAERTLAECEARLDASRSALKTLEAEAQRTRSALGLVEMTLASAVADVVATDSALAALRDEFERCRLRLSQLIGCLLGAGVTTSRVALHENAFVPSPDWTAATARLRADPDAALPNLPPDGPDDARTRARRQAA